MLYLVDLDLVLFHLIFCHFFTGQFLPRFGSPLCSHCGVQAGGFYNPIYTSEEVIRLILSTLCFIECFELFPCIPWRGANTEHASIHTMNARGLKKDEIGKHATPELNYTIAGDSDTCSNEARMWIFVYYLAKLICNSIRLRCDNMHIFVQFCNFYAHVFFIVWYDVWCKTPLHVNAS